MYSFLQGKQYGGRGVIKKSQKEKRFQQLGPIFFMTKFVTVYIR